MIHDTSVYDSRARQALPGNPARLLASSYTLRILIYLALHMALALFMRQSQAVATAHALITAGLGLVWLVRDHEPKRLVYLTAYITGAELLWRMTGAAVFWEFGKYAISLLLLLSLLKQQKLFRADKQSVVYFVLLLPSILLLPSFDREAISTNLSGPFSLMAASMFFSTVKLDRGQIQNILVAMLLPIAGVAFLTTYSTITADSITFGQSSLAVTAGDFGANQVSSVLGLGALIIFLFILLQHKRLILRLLLLLCSLWFMAQAALTFSRSGLVVTIGVLAGVSLYLLRDQRSRVTFLLGSTMLFVVGYYGIFPVLEEFTAGALSHRFTNLQTTGRDLIFQADLLAFRQNPLFGVGPGQSREYHALLFRTAQAHTEFSRILAEHGSLGLLALLILLRMTMQRMRTALPPLEKAFILSLTAWAIFFMLHSAMRLVAPSFMFGLASAHVSQEAESDIHNDQ